MEIGYARVSTHQQDTALQRAALERAGVDRIVEEKRSGARVRPGLDQLIAGLQAGDVVVVYKLDRLGRSLVDLLRLLAKIEAAGASFRSLTEAIETRTPVGRMMLQMLGVLAEFERALIRERCQAGRLEAVRRGVLFGRPVKARRDDVLRLRADGFTLPAIADQLGCALSSVKRAWRGIRRCDGGPGLERSSRSAD